MKRSREDAPCCTICQEILYNPVTLPCCGNSFDMHCIRKVKCCPLCRSPISVTPSVNLALRSVMQQMYQEELLEREKEIQNDLFLGAVVDYITGQEGSMRAIEELSELTGDEEEVFIRAFTAVSTRLNLTEVLNRSLSSGFTKAANVVLDMGAKATPYALIKAAEDGHLRLVQRMVQFLGCDVADSGGWTPLHLAVEKNHLEVVKQLIWSGADVNVISNDGWTPLHVAVDEGHLNMVRYLLEQGVDVTYPNVSGRTPIHSAAELGYIEIVRALCAAGSDINIQDVYGVNPLMLALIGKHESVIELLISKKVDLNQRDNDRVTAIHLAACSNLVHLIPAGSVHDVNCETSAGRTPLYMAVCRGHTRAVRCLIEAGAIDQGRYSSIHRAAALGHLDILRVLIDKGGNVESYKTDWTPMRCAAANGHVDAMGVLIEAGASLQDSSKVIRTAVEKGQTECVKFILERGKQLDCRMNRFLVNTAARYGHTNVVKVLSEVCIN